METRGGANAEEILSGLGISAHTPIPDDVPTVADLLEYKFKKAPRGEKGALLDDVQAFYKATITAFKKIYKIIEDRDVELLKLADIYGETMVKLNNANSELEQVRTRGVQILEESVAGVDVDVAIENAELKKTNRAYAEEIASLKNQINAREEDDRQIREWGERAQVEFAKMEKLLEQRDEEIARMKSPGSLEMSLAQAKKEFDTKIALAEEERRQWENKNKEKDSIIAQLEAEKVDMLVQIDALTTTISDEKEIALEAKDGLKKIEELESALIDKEAEIQRKEERLGEYERYAKQVSEYVHQLENQLEEAKSKQAAVVPTATPVIGEDLDSSDNPWDFGDNASFSLEEVQRRFGINLDNLS